MFVAAGMGSCHELNGANRAMVIMKKGGIPDNCPVVLRTLAIIFDNSIFRFWLFFCRA